MTTATGSATTTPLPTVIGGAFVRLIRQRGMARLAPLFYVSSTQINFQIPPGTSDGTALVSIGVNGVFNGFGTLDMVGRVSPGSVYGGLRRDKVIRRHWSIVTEAAHRCSPTDPVSALRSGDRPEWLRFRSI
jgi:uncharacterized protein (TIGR03437 family)